MLTSNGKSSMDIRSESSLSEDIGAEFEISESSCDYDTVDQMVLSSSSPSSSSDSDNYNSSDEVFVPTTKSCKENQPIQLFKNVASFSEKKKPSPRSKDEETYRRKRQRNNDAVKRSRDKARQRQKESQRYLAELTAENRRLQLKADVLLKELSLLRGLFPTVEESAASSDLLADVDALLSDLQ